jgi:hypothetical protein
VKVTRAQLAIAILCVPLLVISYLIALEVRENLNCRSVINERNISNKQVLNLEADALKEWNSFPLMGDGTEARDPTPNSGGRYFSNFEGFYRSEYATKIQNEKELGYRLVLGYPECFPLREVLEIQAILND